MFILDGLRSEEMQTAKRLNQDLIDGCNAGMRLPRPAYKSIKSRGDFFGVMRDIEQACATRGFCPIVHIEAHGRGVEGLEIGDAKELVEWSEISDKMRRINQACGNNAGLVLASCHGDKALLPVNIDRPAPFYFLIANIGEKPAGLLHEQAKRFYWRLYETSLLEKAFAELDISCIPFVAETFLCTVLAGFYAQHSVGSGAAKRVERYVTQRVETSGKAETSTLKLHRKQAKEFVRDRRAIFERQVKVFLHGRTDLDFDVLEKFVLESIR